MKRTYVNGRGSMTDHIVRSVEFGGRVVVWCGYELSALGGIESNERARPKGRICEPCSTARSEWSNRIVHDPGAQGCWIIEAHTMSEHKQPQEAPF